MTIHQNPDKAIWRIAHRGARDEAPENTRAAFARALAFPISGIELDVQMSADGVPVLYHDRTLYRVTGRRKRVAELTYDQLAQIDWGRWFGPAFAGTPLLTLDQVLVDLGGRTRLLIEIKSRTVDRKSGHALDIADAVSTLLQTHQARLSTHGAKDVHVLSFDSQVLHRAHGLAPQWRYVLNVDERTTPSSELTSDPGLAAILWGVCVDIRRLTPVLAQWAHSYGLRVFTYTCNGPRQVTKALDMNVDAILSDRPGWLTRHMQQLGV